MKKLKRVVSRKTGRVGYRGQFTDRQTGKRIQKTIWVAERIDAEKAFLAFQSASARREHNLADDSGWKLGYADLVKRFLAGCAVSADRRERLKVLLEKNPLKLTVSGELCSKGVLKQKCKTLAQTEGAVYVAGTIQQPLKQLATWAAETELIPFDPLKAWKKITRDTPRRKKRAFNAEELRAILQASDELDALMNLPLPLSVVFKTILITGNRPGALTRATVADFDGQAIKLPPGTKTKRNGAATIPPEFATELQRYIMKRGRPDEAQRLLVTQKGNAISMRNLSDSFRRASTFAFVKLNWPEKDEHAKHATPLDIAQTIFAGKLVGFDGRQPTAPEKIAQRQQRKAAIEALTKTLTPQVEKHLAGRPLYALRHTHITWARRFVNFDAVRAQVGHAAKDIEEQHYNDEDFVDARASSQVVWDVLIGKKTLKRTNDEQIALPIAVGQTTTISQPESKTPHRDQRASSSQTSSIVGVIEAPRPGFEPGTLALTVSASTKDSLRHAASNRPFSIVEKRSLGCSPATPADTAGQTKCDRSATVSPDLASVIDRWDNLPEHIRQSILTLVRAGGGS